MILRSLSAYRCASACSSFAWACIQLGVSPATESVDRYSGQVTVDSFEQRFAKGIPAAFKDHIGALLPGLHALAYSSLLAGSAGRDQAQALFQKIVTMQPLEACLKVGYSSCFAHALVC